MSAFPHVVVKNARPRCIHQLVQFGDTGRDIHVFSKRIPFEFGKSVLQKSFSPVRGAGGRKPIGFLNGIGKIFGQKVYRGA